MINHIPPYLNKADPYSGNNLAVVLPCGTIQTTAFESGELVRHLLEPLPLGCQRGQYESGGPAVIPQIEETAPHYRYDIYCGPNGTL